MTVPRVFLDKPPGQDSIVLEGPTAHRLLRVLRVYPDKEIILFGWGPEEAVAVVTETGPDYLIAKIKGLRKRENKGKTITVLAGILKHQQMDALIENAAMVGVTRLVPIITQRTVARIDADKVARKVVRWNEIARNASALACMTPPMTVNAPLAFEDAIARASGTTLLLYESGDQLLARWLANNRIGNEVTLIIGPEGGWTDAEIEEASRYGVVPVLLGPWVLRPSVAVVVATTLVHYATRDEPHLFTPPIHSHETDTQ